jgi:hypothetical protein
VLSLSPHLKKIGALTNPKNGKKGFVAPSKLFLPFLGFDRAPIFFRLYGDDIATAADVLWSTFQKCMNSNRALVSIAASDMKFKTLPENLGENNEDFSLEVS